MSSYEWSKNAALLSFKKSTFSSSLNFPLIILTKFLPVHLLAAKFYYLSPTR